MQSHDDQTLERDAFLVPRPHRQRTEPKVWLAAFLLTLLFHGAMISVILVSRPFAPSPVEAKPPDPIELVFAVAEQVPSEKEEPTFFSELPEDRADEPPETADFLSNVDSRARDLAPGGEEAAMPRLEDSSEAPHIRMDPATQPSEQSQPEIVQQDPKEPTPPGETSPASGSDVESHTDERALVPKRADQRHQPDPPVPVEQETPAPILRPSSPGLAEFFQDEMERPESNTALSGIVSINTTAWDYAPWLQQFRRDFLRSWAAPVAYYMGIIDGYTVVELEIAPSGELTRLDRIDGQGHESLHQCSEDVFTALAPYRPLPESFPEESLILRIKLVYPPARRR